jgi:hypothetical protein
MPRKVRPIWAGVGPYATTEKVASSIARSDGDSVGPSVLVVDSVPGARIDASTVADLPPSADLKEAVASPLNRRRVGCTAPAQAGQRPPYLPERFLTPRRRQFGPGVVSLHVPRRELWLSDGTLDPHGHAKHPAATEGRQALGTPGSVGVKASNR